MALDSLSLSLSIFFIDFYGIFGAPGIASALEGTALSDKEQTQLLRGMPCTASETSPDSPETNIQTPETNRHKKHQQIQIPIIPEF